MSENKYIIDKDSLTGIADAVRDKLGAGEATTDSQTGDIIYPEDKGYYLKEAKVAGLVYPGDKGSQTPFMNVSNETVQELCGGIVPTYIKFTVLTLASSHSDSYINPFGLSYNGTKFYLQSDGGYNTYLQNIVGSTKTISYNSTVGCQIIGTSGSYRQSYQTYSYFEYPGSIKIEFLDGNENNILTSVEGPISAGLSSSNYTMEIPTSIVPAKIPFSIGDIQNKITNYLGKKSGLIYRYHINPQNNESGTAFAGSPLSEMNVLDYGVTSVSQIKFMLIYGQNSSFTWSPGDRQYTIIINGKVFRRGQYGEQWPNKSWDAKNPSYSLRLCASKNSTWPLGIMLGTSSSYTSDDTLNYPKIVFMVLDLEATE